jgi:hypothetical protein
MSRQAESSLLAVKPEPLESLNLVVGTYAGWTGRQPEPEAEQTISDVSLSIFGPN